uniref:Uncharacterized protein TCIL3000_11_12140 n=1 Tax=Trypanosoma congolense (strain IL3000) TaxID=1068625 RepID=G0V249_TRYCI|nr:unnamed protein product [Trypanosoma congolense IL3000]
MFFFLFFSCCVSAVWNPRPFFCALLRAQVQACGIGRCTITRLPPRSRVLCCQLCVCVCVCAILHRSFFLSFFFLHRHLFGIDVSGGVMTLPVSKAVMGGYMEKVENSEENQQQLLGAPCIVHLDALAGRRGLLLEVRHLWSPRLLDEDFTELSALPLYGFVRMKDADHRISGWFPIDCIELREGGATSAAVVEAYKTASWVDNKVIRGPIISSVYKEITSGMMRAQQEEKQLDFFEERLLRDCRTPTTIRYFVYLCKFVFPPWYYAPYGVLNREYDPMAPLTATERRQFGICKANSAHDGDTNPFIRDAYLCPFSLRVYSTFEQMQQETLRYRSGRLHPPGQEIYRDEARGFSMFEVNGSRNVTYCRHLFLLGKSFLENKLAGHDVHNYYFYVVCLHHHHFPHYTDDTSAMYFVGYFTWEKQVVANNLACIVTLPYFMGSGESIQRQKATQDFSDSAGTAIPPNEEAAPRLSNFGQFMIAASYELAYRRKNVGSPEKPLTDLGAAAYDRYWRRVLIRWMHEVLEGDVVSTGTEDAQRDSAQQVTVVATVEGRDGTDFSSALKRVRTEAPSSQKAAVEEKNGTREEGKTLVVTTVKSIAAQVRLEEADVLRTLLQMGVLHLNAEDRSMRLVIPVSLVRRECEKMKRWAQDLHRAEFNPKLLNERSTSASHPASSYPRRHSYQTR